MKRFLKGVVECLSHACPVFTVAVSFYALISWLYGEREIGIGILLQLLAISLIDAVIQGIAFSEEWLIRRMSYTKRMMLFVALFLPVLAAFGWAFEWFPTDSLMSWGIFLLIFLAIFVVMLAGFEILFHVTGKKYAGMLGQYRKKHGQDGEDTV